MIMSKFELSISSNYVPDWTVVDAVREIYQNALDEEVQNDRSKLVFEYDKFNKIITITNTNSTLDIRSLLLGKTDKRQNDELIGNHGEGYKIASLVLLRLGKTVTVFNGDKEVWKPRLVKTRRFKGEQVLTFFTESTAIRDNDVKFIIGGITEFDYQDIVKSNLNLQDIPESDMKHTVNGTVLTDDKYKGNLYISGLFVCHNKMLSGGYNYKPGHIKLDRDRRVITDFDVKYETSRIIASSDDKDFIVSMLCEKESVYVGYHMQPDMIQEVSQHYFDLYNGSETIVTSDSSLHTKCLKDGVKSVLVAEGVSEILNKSDLKFKEYVESKSTRVMMEELISKIEDKLTEDELLEANLILRRL